MQRILEAAGVHSGTGAMLIPRQRLAAIIMTALGTVYSPGAYAAAAANNQAMATAGTLDTAYGKLSIHAATGRTELLLDGKPFGSFAADDASLFRLSPHGPRDVVVVRAINPGLHCSHSYMLLAVTAAGPTLSSVFGECKELAGAGFYGSDPVVHLKSSVDDQSGIISYQWKNGDLLQLVESPSVCSATAFLAHKNAQAIPAALQARRATGQGRLQFMSAPDNECPMRGVFVVPGDQLNASLSHGGFIYATYTNPKSGRKVEGWLEAARLPEQP